MLTTRAGEALARLSPSQQHLALSLLRRHQDPRLVPSACPTSPSLKQIEQLSTRLATLPTR